MASPEPPSPLSPPGPAAPGGPRSRPIAIPRPAGRGAALPAALAARGSAGSRSFEAGCNFHPIATLSLTPPGSPDAGSLRTPLGEPSSAASPRRPLRSPCPARLSGGGGSARESPALSIQAFPAIDALEDWAVPSARASPAVDSPCSSPRCSPAAVPVPGAPPSPALPAQNMAPVAQALPSPASTAATPQQTPVLTRVSSIGWQPLSPTRPRRSTISRPLDDLPSVMERWAQMQSTMHTIEPRCTVVVRRPGQSRAVRSFLVLSFILTQGSGKEKLLRFLQNLVTFVGLLSRSEQLKAYAFLVDDQLGRVRRGLRTFESLNEISEMIQNQEPNKRLRWLMCANNLLTAVYFQLDFLTGLVEMSFIRPMRNYASVRRWKDLLFLFQMLIAMAIDGWLYRIGLERTRKARVVLEQHGMSPGTADGAVASAAASALTELRAAAVHRGVLRRAVFARLINLALHAAALAGRAPARPVAAACGMVTAALQLYNIALRVHDNRLTLQFS